MRIDAGAASGIVVRGNLLRGENRRIWVQGESRDHRRRCRLVWVRMLGESARGGHLLRRVKASMIQRPHVAHVRYVLEAVSIMRRRCECCQL